MALQAFKRGTNNLYRFLRGLSIEILHPISMPPFLPTILPGSKSISRILRRREPYHWWVNSILWSIIWESDYDMSRRGRVWHIRNIEVRFKTGVKQTCPRLRLTTTPETLKPSLKNSRMTQSQRISRWSSKVRFSLVLSFEIDEFVAALMSIYSEPGAIRAWKPDNLRQNPDSKLIRYEVSTSSVGLALRNAKRSL